MIYCEVALNYMGKIYHNHTATKHNKARSTCIFRGSLKKNWWIWSSYSILLIHYATNGSYLHNLTFTYSSEIILQNNCYHRSLKVLSGSSTFGKESGAIWAQFIVSKIRNRVCVKSSIYFEFQILSISFYQLWDQIDTKQLFHVQ